MLIDVRMLTETEFRALVLRYLEDIRNAMGKLCEGNSRDTHADGAESRSAGAVEASPSSEGSIYGSTTSATPFPDDFRQPN